MAKAYTHTLHGEDVLRKIIRYYEKHSNTLSVKLELSLEEVAILFCNKTLHQKLKEDAGFNSYFKVALEKNMETWKSESDVFEKFKAFKISQHFITDKDILKILKDFESSIDPNNKSRH